MESRNFISELMEKCAKAKLSAPTFTEDSENSVTGRFSWLCCFEDKRTNGTGHSKKLAKQHSAKLMMETLENENMLSKEPPKENKVSCVSMVNEYCSIKKMPFPLFSEKEKENGLFVCECTLNNFTGKGTGETKKKAKEDAACKVAKHFEILEFHDKCSKIREKSALQKNSVQILQETCQKKRVMPFFNEIVVSATPTTEYSVTCTVGELLVKSEPCFSKKIAKVNAAELMLKMLKEKNYFLNTPDSSPKPNINGSNTTRDAQLSPQNTTPAKPSFQGFLSDDGDSSSNTGFPNTSEDLSQSQKELFARPLKKFLSDSEDDEQPLVKRKVK